MRPPVWPFFLALVIAGCGSEGSGGSGSLSEKESSSALEGSAQRTIDAGRAKVALSGVISSKGSEPVEFEGSGVSNFATRRSRLTLDMSAIARASAGGLEGAPEDWKGTIVYDGDAVYLRVPAIDEKCWVGYDATLGASQGNTGFSAPDPDDLLRFAEVARNVEVIGDEVVRGVDTTHLRGKIDVDDLPRIGSGDRRAGFEVYARSLKEAGLETISFDAWLDGGGRIRRLKAEYEDLAAGGSNVDVSYAMDVFDFGTDEKVKIPPASAFGGQGSC